MSRFVLVVGLAAVFLVFVAIILAQGGKEVICNDGIDNDGDGKIDCADPNCNQDPICSGGVPVGPTLVIVDSIGKEIGVVVDRWETSFFIGRPVVAFTGATVAQKVSNTTVLFNLSTSLIRGNTQALNADIGNGDVVFTDPNCTSGAYIRVDPTSNPEMFIAPLTAVTADPGGVCCATAPGTTLHIADPGPFVQIGQWYLINSWGGCFPGDTQATAIPVTAALDIRGFVPPFRMHLR